MRRPESVESVERDEREEERRTAMEKVESNRKGGSASRAKRRCVGSKKPKLNSPRRSVPSFVSNFGHGYASL